jgi:type IV secretory pathway VirD2 relaxase
MSQDDEDHFRPRPGRIRSDARGGAATRSFFTRVRKIARRHGAGQLGTPAHAKSNGTGRARGKVGAGRGVRRGRGAAFIRGRALGGREWSHRQPGARRIIVKSRSVRAAGKNGRAAAHLRYIQRDGTSRDGERGRLYSATQDRADGDAFLDRGKDDRHQFRFIVSPEDSADLGDLTGFTRDLMSRLESDLGTKLDWVAVNHFNTGHPHVHVIVSGRDELGEDLVINGDYIAHGIRERASELVTLELGSVTEIEQRRKLVADIDQDRFTRIDRALIAEAGEGLLDLRHAPADPRGVSDRALRLARLGKLKRMELATEQAPGRWQLSDRLESTLWELGERGDIIKAMHKVLEAEGIQRDPASFQIHDGAPALPIVGRVIDKQLSELDENLTLIVDGIDGHAHHVPGIDPAGVEDARIGSISGRLKWAAVPPIARLPKLRRRASIGRAAIWSRPGSTAAFPAATMTASSTPMSAGSRRYAVPGSSSGSTQTIGVSPKILRAAAPPMMPDEIGSSTFACFRPSIWKARSRVMARPGSIAGSLGAGPSTLCRPASGRTCSRPWIVAAST